MNEGQQKFHDYIMQHIDESQNKIAEQLLADSFSHQDDGTFNTEYLQDFIPKMLSLIKPESVNEVKGSNDAI